MGGASHPAACWLASYSGEALSLERQKGTVEAVRRIFGRRRYSGRPRRRSPSQSSQSLPLALRRLNFVGLVQSMFFKEEERPTPHQERSDCQWCASSHAWPCTSTSAKRMRFSVRCLCRRVAEIKK